MLNIVIHTYKRRIIWFNPPFSTNVKANIGKIFFKLLLKHFPNTNKLYKIFTKNTVKISYSCMKNIGSIISAHNQRSLTPNSSSFGCNCKNKSNCPLEEKCLTPKVIYQADATNDEDDEYKIYKHSEFVNNCRHKRKLLLGSMKDSKD